MAEMALQKLRQRFSNTTPMTSSSAESGMRSLELVRIAVQNAFDKEIDELVKQYIEVIKRNIHMKGSIFKCYGAILCFRLISSRPLIISRRI